MSENYNSEASNDTKTPKGITLQPPMTNDQTECLARVDELNRLVGKVLEHADNDEVFDAQDSLIRALRTVIEKCELENAVGYNRDEQCKFDEQNALKRELLTDIKKELGI